jgi:hypothetical protein
MTSHFDEPDMSSLSPAYGRAGAASPDLASLGRQWTRTSQLACEGALSLLLSTSVRDAWDGLVRAGIEWEDEYTRVPERRTHNPSGRS